jgi:hypothetical protein
MEQQIPIVDGNGARRWYHQGQLHRVGGPAIEWCTGDCSWWRHGQLHRVDGPAVEYIGGTRNWSLNGASLTEQQFYDRINSPVKQKMTIEEIEGILGHGVEIVK